MDFFREQPKGPASVKLRTTWSGPNLLAIYNQETGSTLFKADESGIEVSLAANQVGEDQIQAGAVTETKIGDGAVSPKKTSENWLEVGASIMANQKYSLLVYSAGVVALADPNDSIVGVAYNDAQIDPPDEIPIQEGLVSIIADGSISEGTDLKAGWYGRAQTWRESATELRAAIDGEDNLFTGASQPGGTPGPVQIEQATNEAADRGKRVTIFGTDAADDPISEVVELDGTDTTTAVAGTEDFKNVTGAVFEQDAAANIQVQRASDDAVICTITTGNDDVGAPFMTTQTYAYCSKVHVVADAQADEWLTIVGLGADYNEQMERLQLDNADPGKVTSANDYRIVTRLITGELDNTKAHTVTAVADVAGDKVGKALEAAITDGDIIKAYIKPNLV